MFRRILHPRTAPLIWRDVVNHPDVHVVAELIGGTGVAREIIEASIAQK